MSETAGYIKGKFTNFIVKLIKNSAINYYKQKELYQSRISDIDIENIEIMEGEIMSSSFFDPKTKPEDVFSDLVFYNAMKKLSDKQKQVLWLLVVEDIKAEEVAKRFNTNVNNIYRIKNEAIKKFREYCKGEK